MGMAGRTDGGIGRVGAGVGNIRTAGIQPGELRMGDFHRGKMAGKAAYLDNTARKIFAVTALAHCKSLVYSCVGEAWPCLGGSAMQ
jgi:hypothetical protein